VSYYGPGDEYIVAGCDGGFLWVWDAFSGTLPVKNFHDDLRGKPKTLATPINPCKVLNVLTGDRNIVNGVVPHPYKPLLASYGIDNEVKIWSSYGEQESDDDELPSVSTYDQSMAMDEVVSARLQERLQSKLARRNLKMRFTRHSQVPVLLERNLCVVSDGSKCFDTFNAARVFRRCDTTNLDSDYLGVDDWHAIYTCTFDADVRSLSSGFKKSWARSWGGRLVVDIERFRKTVYSVRCDPMYKCSKDEVPDYPSDFATMMTFSRPIYNPAVDAVDSLGLYSAIQCRQCDPTIPMSWNKVKATVQDEGEGMFSFRRRLEQRFLGTQCQVLIADVFRDEFDGFENIAAFLSEDIRMMFYLYTIAIDAKEIGNAAFKTGDVDEAYLYYSKAERYLSFISLDLIEKLVLWQMSFLMEDNIQRCFDNWHGYDELIAITQGPKKCFLRLLKVQSWFVQIITKQMLCKDVACEEERSVFVEFLRSAYGFLLLEILSRKAVLLNVMVLSNKAACYLKMGQYKGAVSSCSLGLKIAESSIMHHGFLTFLADSDSFKTLTIKQPLSLGDDGGVDNVSAPLGFHLKPCLEAIEEYVRASIPSEVIGKLYFRRAAGNFIDLDDVEKAEEDFLMSKSLSPKDGSLIEKKLEQIKAIKSKGVKLEKKRMKRMFA
jgi:tetratricopeptide (TPR) repeat protein